MAKGKRERGVAPALSDPAGVVDLAHQPQGWDQGQLATIEGTEGLVAFDQRLALCDIAGSIAHARMLSECGVLTHAEYETIAAGLSAVRADIEAGRFTWSVKLEDVHMNVESALVARVGEVGKKLHTARSRNDQVATDFRLWVRDTIDMLDAAFAESDYDYKGLMVDVHASNAKLARRR